MHSSLQADEYLYDHYFELCYQSDCLSLFCLALFFFFSCLFALSFGWEHILLPHFVELCVCVQVWGAGATSPSLESSVLCSRRAVLLSSAIPRASPSQGVRVFPVWAVHALLVQPGGLCWRGLAGWLCPTLLVACEAGWIYCSGLDMGCPSQGREFLLGDADPAWGWSLGVAVGVTLQGPCQAGRLGRWVSSGPLGGSFSK